MHPFIGSARLKLVVGLCLMIGTAAEALYYSYLRPEPSPDESKCSIATVRFILSNRRPLLFLYSNSYMAPALETAVVPVCALTRATPLTVIRGVGATFLGLSAFALLYLLSLEFSLSLSAAVTIAYGLATPWLLSWKLKAPGYPVGLFCCFAFLFVIMRFRMASFTQGALAGLLHYIFPISIAFIVATFLCRTTAGAVVRAAGARLLGLLRSRRPGGVLSLAALAAALVFGMAVAYGVLTERLQNRTAYLVPLAAGALIAAAFWVLLFALHRSDPLDFAWMKRCALPPALFLLGCAAIEFPVKSIFGWVEAPYFSSHGMALWTGNGYAWKQWSSWPGQVSAYLGRTLPQAFLPIGPRSWIPLYGRDVHPRVAMLLGILALAIMLAAVTRLRSASGARASSLDRFLLSLFSLCPSATFFWAFAIMSLILIPSWRLFGDPSVRYLTPYFPAVYLGFAVVLRQLFRKSRAI